ncbi:MAG TPA: MBL fold metallo-hydrolase [Luteibaculaceae bacterium]|nr:MBL fold metallo-hydrolase [Luteibaculaceae bacterium]
MASVTCYGGAGTVTGSKHLITTRKGVRFLIDCGLFQGPPELRELNRQLTIDDPSTLAFILLTHAHLDHTGYLPYLVKKGFAGPIYGTSPTLALAEVILFDSAVLQEEEAREANERGYSKHKPAKPLYEEKDVKNCLPLCKAVDPMTWFEPHPSVKVRMQPVGHILGACFIEVQVDGLTLVFSGDIGRNSDLLLEPPRKPSHADYLFMECTYGDRRHDPTPAIDQLRDLVKNVIDRRRQLIIPCFAVERAQIVMLLLDMLHREWGESFPEVVLDSPMSHAVVETFKNYPKWHKPLQSDWTEMARNMSIVRDYQHSMESVEHFKPRIVIAGSGMVNGGRVLSYLEKYIENSHTTIALVGYQAEGTRGRDLLDGLEEVWIKGEKYAVRAEITHLGGMSAHADQQELMDWLSELQSKPKQVVLIHGEEQPALKLQSILQQHRHKVTIAQRNQSIILD